MFISMIVGLLLSLILLVLILSTEGEDNDLFRD